MSRSCTWAAVLVLALSALASAAGTTPVLFRVISMGGNVYRYVYTLTNNGSLPGGAPLQLFDIYFDSSLYQSASLTIVTPPSLQAQWNEIIFHPAPGLPAAYDVLTLAGGLPVGATISGFSVQFTWLGTGVPGSQPFEIFDPNTFLSLQSGQTISDTTPIPAASPFSLGLMGIALAVAACLQARSRNEAVRES
jgi:hypothetical protein